MATGRRIVAMGVGLLWVVGATVVHASGHTATHSHKKTARRPSKVEPKSAAIPRKADDRPAAKPEERSPTVAFTVLPGDTHAKLASDLTGENGHEEALRRIDPTLKPGETIRVPSNLLLPGLADVRRETVVFGGKYPTLWSVARQTQSRSAADVGRTARNLQRLNAILSADHLAPGTKILVPKAWLEIGGPRPSTVALEREPEPLNVDAGMLSEDDQGLEAPEAPIAATIEPPILPPIPALPAFQAPAAPRPGGAVPFAIQKQYVVRDVDGLGRRTARLPSRLHQVLSDREYEKAHEGRGEISLVVVHTTEHRGSTFENTAAYIHRKRLANYVIGPDGTAYEVVPEEYRAYGCGDSVWEGRYYVDLEAINIEVYANTDKGPHQGGISDAQYEGLKALLADIRARRPMIDAGRVVTHRMVALNFKTGTRSRKGDPFEFEWEKAGLPDNSSVADRDLMDGRAKICTDCRFTDRVTAGQTEALKALNINKKL